MPVNAVFLLLLLLLLHFFFVLSSFFFLFLSSLFFFFLLLFFHLLLLLLLSSSSWGWPGSSFFLFLPLACRRAPPRTARPCSKHASLYSFLFSLPGPVLSLSLSLFLSLSLSLFSLSLSLLLVFFSLSLSLSCMVSFRVRGVQLEVSELLPQGSLACGSHAFTATLLIDPLMSALRFVGFFLRYPCLDFCLIW